MMYTITRGPSKLVTQRRTGAEPSRKTLACAFKTPWISGHVIVCVLFLSGPTQQQIDSKATDLKHKRSHWLESK